MSFGNRGHLTSTGTDSPLVVRQMLWLPLWMSAGVVVAVLLSMLFVSWRNLHRLEPIEAHLDHIQHIEDVALSMEQTLLSDLRGQPIQPSQLLELRTEVATIARAEGALHPDTATRLAQIEAQLGTTAAHPEDVLFRTLAEMRQVLDGERERHNELLTRGQEDARTEITLTALLLLTVPLLLGASLLTVQRRARQPLRALEELLGRLGRKDYRPVPGTVIDEMDGLAQPAFHSYNALVSRLKELESEHRDREQTLEHEVRRATEALLAQSRELGRAERLAAVGAVSAGLAHELRNPLAGIQMACGKLHRALGHSEHAARIAAVIDELTRINHLLTSQVDAARHSPEPLEVVAVDRLVAELLTLLRYQVPDGVQIDARVPGELRCLLPVAGLRQTLLNLVLNAVQAMPATGRIEIAAERADTELSISVSDSGPGFPAELLRAGIRPFATGRQGGTGLGLAMVRRFVRDHDGDLQLANREPHGAVVTLRLPCASADASGALDHA
ncbi:MAG: ATP-binding protein [Thiohalocapsa sp.]|nr:ATP-binding protein [Thiohalocapsa sp.]